MTATVHATVAGALGYAARAQLKDPSHHNMAEMEAYFLMMNPGLTAIALTAFAAVLLRRRLRALLGWCAAAALIVLLNGACWGALSTRPGW